MSGEASVHILISTDRVFNVLTRDISDPASADGECGQVVRYQGEVWGPGGDLLPGGQVQPGGAREQHQPHAIRYPEHGQGLVSEIQ